jgi:hypothetical protein
MDDKRFVRFPDALYPIALPATYLRRCGGFTISAQVFDLTPVYDATSPAPHRVT